MGFGVEIKRLREEAGVSVQKLADKIGVKAERMRKWEQMDGSPRDEDRARIERFFQLPISELVKLESIKQYLNVVDDDYDRAGPDEKYVALMEERISDLKRDKEWLQKTVDLSLSGLMVGQKSILAHLVVILEQEAIKEAHGDKKKASRIMENMDKRVGEIVVAAPQKGTSAGK